MSKGGVLRNREGEPVSRESRGHLAGWIVTSVFAVAILSATVTTWLSEPLFSQVLWPADINFRLARLLGGTVATSIAGTEQINLSSLAVFGRFLLALWIGSVTAGGMAKLRRLPFAVRFQIFLKRLSFAVLLSVLWWGPWLLADLGVTAAGELALGLLPIWLMATLGMIVWAIGNLLSSSTFATTDVNTPDLVKPCHRSAPWLILTVITICWVGVSFWLNKLLYDQLMIPHGDSAMYEEHLWNFWHGKGFRSYLDQGLFLGEHIQVIHLLLLPLHWIWPSHLLLELSESIALGCCSLIIYSMTFRHSGSRMAALWMGLAWLCFFPMHFLDMAIDQKTFRPIVLGLPFLFGMIHYGEQGHVGKTLICLVLALSAKEDVALVACPILAVLAYVHRRRGVASEVSNGPWKLMLGLSIATAGYLVVTVLVIIPAFRSGEHVHYARYFGSLGNSPGELIQTALRDPLAVLAQAFRVQTFIYLAVFLVPLSMLPARRILVLSSGVITFTMLSLLQFSTDAADLPPVPYHHFHAPLLPVVFWAAICALSGLKGGLEKVESPNNRRHWTRLSSSDWSSLAFSCCFFTAFTGSLSPLGATFWSEQSRFAYQQLYSPSDPQRQLRADSIDLILAKIPLEARVASTDYVHTRLTHYARSYDYSGYLRAVNNYEPGVPPDTDFIVLDLIHPYSRIRSATEVPELKAPAGEWSQRDDLSNSCFLVLQRTGIEEREDD